MNIQENDLNSAQITASNEANAAGAATEMELVENSEGDASEIDSLVDYNILDAAEAAAEAEKKAAEQKALAKRNASKQRICAERYAQI
jgi:hypothetical protein